MKVLAEMALVRRVGMGAARHLTEDIYEARIHVEDNSFRLLFCPEGGKGRILLAVVLFAKRTQKTPKSAIELARQRRNQWRAQGQPSA